MTLTVGSLCSGYTGLEMGLAEVLPTRTVWHCENDPHASKVLGHHWPKVPNNGDIKTADWTAVEPVDVVTAGYPCQPFSHAGKRAGTDDPRHLWPAVADAVRVLRPRLVVLENVAGHLSLGFDVVQSDLAALGYCVRWTCLRASDVGAPHRRDRLFVVASDAGRLPGSSGRGTRSGEAARGWASGEPPGRGGAPAPHSSGEHGERTLRGGDRSGGPVLPSGDSGGAPADADCGGREVREEQHGYTPRAAADRHPRRQHPDGHSRTDWGVYAPAIARWERTLRRPAPAPTDGRRLSPRFVEWMQGLPDGWVTGVPGVTRNAALKILGNGVVPQQAAAALGDLLSARQAVA